MKGSVKILPTCEGSPWDSQAPLPVPNPLVPTIRCDCVTPYPLIPASNYDAFHCTSSGWTERIGIFTLQILILFENVSLCGYECFVVWPWGWPFRLALYLDNDWTFEYFCKVNNLPTKWFCFRVSYCLFFYNRAGPVKVGNNVVTISTRLTTKR